MGARTLSDTSCQSCEVIKPGEDGLEGSALTTQGVSRHRGVTVEAPAWVRVQNGGRNAGGASAKGIEEVGVEWGPLSIPFAFCVWKGG